MKAGLIAVLLFVLTSACVPTGTPVSEDPNAVEGRSLMDAGDSVVDAALDRDGSQPDAGSREPGPCDEVECNAATPYCDPAVGRCEICLTDDHCDVPGTRCLAHTCVECVSNDDCDGLAGRPYCVADVCAGCADDGDCPSSTPYCVNSACVECRAGVEEDCAESPVGRGCFNGACGDCASHADCGSPELARCDPWNRCMPCESDEECTTHVGDAGQLLAVCDSGTCVECTGTQYAGCNDGATQYVCDALLRECSEELAASAPPCWPCVSDAQCKMGFLCMRTIYGTKDDGLFCMAIEAELPGGMCSGTFTVPEESWTSVEGVKAVVCRHSAMTCRQYWDLPSN